MFDWLRKRPKPWPQPSIELLRKRARLLVIDDQDFPYQALFERDGYTIQKWSDVDDLSKLESNEFDVILLDMHGVGRKETKEQGFGILKHIRKEAPAQIVIAYSNADWSLKYQAFFDMANARLDKRADYVEFKRVVDEQLRQRFSIQFYVESVVNVVGTSLDRDKLKQLAEKAILTGETDALEKFVRGSPISKENLKVALAIVRTGIHVGAVIAAA